MKFLVCYTDFESRWTDAVTIGLIDPTEETTLIGPYTKSV